MEILLKKRGTHERAIARIMDKWDDLGTFESLTGCELEVKMQHLPKECLALQIEHHIRYN